MRDARLVQLLFIVTVLSACSSGGGNDFPESTPTTTAPTTTTTPTSSTTTQTTTTQTTTGTGNSGSGGYYYNDPYHEDGEPYHEHDEDGNDIRPSRPNRPNRSVSAAVAPPATAQIVADTHGQALAIWRAFDGTRNNLWTDRFNGVNWIGARVLETNDGDVGNAHIALDATGNAIAAWEQETQGDRAIWAARFDIVRGWQAASVISRSPDGLRVDAFNAQVSANADTSMVVRWQQIDSALPGLVTSTNVSRWWENRFTPGLGWSGATLMPTPR